MSLALLLAGGANAAAPTAREQLEKVLKKYATTPVFGEKDRAACVCRAASLAGRAGWLRRVEVETGGGTTRFLVDCVVQDFGPQGTVFGASSCNDFAVLGR
jgi:hypothetical protein